MTLSNDLKTDPAYHDGFFAAQDGEPLFPGASAAYEAGWRAFWRAREILQRMGFAEGPHGRFTKTTVISATPQNLAREGALRRTSPDSKFPSGEKL